MCFLFTVKHLIKKSKLTVMAKEKGDNIIKDINDDKIIKFRKQTQVLLVTANEIERDAVVALLEPIENNNLFQYHHLWNFGFLERSAMYTFGKFGAFNAALQMLSCQGSAAAQDAITIASECFGDNLCAIFAVGVACGVTNKSNYLDVLVSEEITCYNLMRHGTEEKGGCEMINTDMVKLNTSSVFSKHFRTHSGWPSESSKIANALLIKPQMRMGLILSGDFLVDNQEFKDHLLLKKDFGYDAVGIEMEGGGLFYEYKQNRCEVMIVKAVCDFGDGNKDKEYQPTAALLAVECLKHYLDDDTLLNIISDAKCKLK